jgi:hypothetical protein
MPNFDQTRAEIHARAVLNYYRTLTESESYNDVLTSECLFLDLAEVLGWDLLERTLKSAKAEQKHRKEPF